MDKQKMLEITQIHLHYTAHRAAKPLLSALKHTMWLFVEFGRLERR